MVKKHYDELCEGQRLIESKSRFRVTVFYPLTNVILSQLDNRFKSMKSIKCIDTYRVVKLYFLVTFTEL